MDQQPDKLFRDKLHGYDSPVPSHVWSRVEANVHPKRKTLWWLSAAAVALIGTTVVFLFSLPKQSTKLAETVTEPARQEQSPAISESNASIASEKQAITKTADAPRPKPNADELSSGKKRSTPKKKEQPASEREISPTVALPEPQPVSIAQQEPMLAPAKDETNVQNNPGRKTITIVFSAREVNEKYLSKINPADATSTEEEASRLKNMLDKAYDLTHNQSPLGELRQKKNEILAMNFRKDKPRTQND